MPFQKGQRPPKKGEKLSVTPANAELTSADIDAVKEAMAVKPESAPLPPVSAEAVKPVTPGFDDFYALTVDYITTPSGNPLEGKDGTISRSALYEAGVNIEAQLQMGAIRHIGRMEV